MNSCRIVLLICKLTFSIGNYDVDFVETLEYFNIPIGLFWEEQMVDRALIGNNSNIIFLKKGNFKKLALKYYFSFTLPWTPSPRSHWIWSLRGAWRWQDRRPWPPPWWPPGMSSRQGWAARRSAPRGSCRSGLIAKYLLCVVVLFLSFGCAILSGQILFTLWLKHSSNLTNSFMWCIDGSLTYAFIGMSFCNFVILLVLFVLDSRFSMHLETM